MAFEDISQSIANTVGNLGSALSPSGRSRPYTEYEGVTNKIKTLNWKLSLPYSFQITADARPDGKSSSFYHKLQKVIDFVGTPAGGNMFGEFSLPINPSDITQDENFAIHLTPTQNGVISEHNGIVFKDLVISGTTGMRPAAGKTGYEYFQELRNYFRAYGELKKDPTKSNSQLLFINRKDNEKLVVEPVKFTMRRSAAGPFLYNYVIVLKVLGLYKAPSSGLGKLGEFFGKIDKIINMANDYINRAKMVFMSVTSTLQTVEREFTSTLLEPINNVSLALQAMAGMGLTLYHLPGNIANTLSSETVKSMLDIGKAFGLKGDSRFDGITFPVDTRSESINNRPNALKIFTPTAMQAIPIDSLTPEEKTKVNTEIIRVATQPRQFYDDLLVQVKRIRDNAAEMFGVGDDNYNKFVGRDKTFIVSATRVPVGDEFDLLNAFDLAIRGMGLILSTNALFQNSLANYIKDVQDNYDSGLILSNPASVNEVTLPDNTTLEDMASIYLGTANRWIEIAVLNNLKSPYIDENSNDPRVKKPGDKILIPSAEAPGVSNIPKTKIYPSSEGLTETERNLGVDIRLNKDFDFVMNNANDLELVASGANAGQAVIIKLSLEKGSLKYHPWIGVGLNIGEKIRNGVDIRDDLISSVLSDSRFTDMRDLSFIQDGDAFKINFNLAVRYLSTPVPLTLNV